MAQLRPMSSVTRAINPTRSAGGPILLDRIKPAINPGFMLFYGETIVMRILLLLIVLVIIGLTLSRQLSSPPAPSRPPPEATAPIAAPAVPTHPQDLKSFEQDINRFMQDAATQRRRQADPP